MTTHKKQVHTPGPWAWYGDPKNGFYLATQHGGRRHVMTFERLGFDKAQPAFSVYTPLKTDPTHGHHILTPGKELCRFEVAPHVVGFTAARKSAGKVYRLDIVEFDHPDARLIAAAPELYKALMQLSILAHECFDHLKDKHPVQAYQLKEYAQDGLTALRHATEIDYGTH